MKKDIYIVLSLILLFQLVDVSLLFGQGFLINQVKTIETRNALVNKSYSDIEGSPYINNNFIESRLYSIDGNITDLSLRYDAFQDEMEFMKDEKVKWINKKEVTGIKYGKDTVIVSFMNVDTTRQSYFFTAGKGKYSLLLRKRVTFQQARPPRGYADAIPDKFINENDETYLKPGKSPAIKIKNSKDLAKFFINDKTALNFIKKERIRGDKFADLDRLVSFLNGL